MATITAAMVKELREKTDAPMMECKKALTEANGDMDHAEEILRVKLGNKATKAATRVTAEGLIGVYISEDRRLASMIEVNCETDFVAKNDDFIQFVEDLAKLVADKNPADVDALSNLPMRDGTVESIRTALVGKIGENMTIRRFHRIETEHAVNSYIHGNRIGVLVEYAGQEQVGKDLAMHIAASKPKAIDQAGVSAEDIERERSIAEMKAKESGKPEAIIEKMITGSVAKFLKEVTLLSQPFVKNPDLSVEQMLKQEKTQVHSFKMFIVGEGIEKRSSDFAAEVAAAVAGN